MYVLVMTCHKGKCNVIQYGSNKCRWISRSVMAAEVQYLFLGYYYVFLVRNLDLELLGYPLTIEATIESKTVSRLVRMLMGFVHRPPA